ncbi:MAG TPA: hypothetical protein H9815_16800 [Candidatus Ruania gallistercoris]|uniref:Uncharacterized protein n=1 Tax=Candidatus Ruania gallistercoris TaxID=2838746 RepID=A0A9D2EH86_9MICO|nr:hypothetical protein [Candidatus Ruania gallistercoris]
MAVGATSPRTGHAQVRVAVGLLIVLVLAAGWLLRGVLINADGVDVPPAHQMPAVPTGATVGPVEKRCGSGGCYLEQRVEPPDGTSVTVLADQMQVTEQRCSRLDLLAWRSTCTGSHPVDDHLLVYLLYESPLAF